MPCLVLMGEIVGTITPVKQIAGTVCVPDELTRDTYVGPYDVTPKLVEQRLSTAYKLMSSDVIVHEIPYFENDNVSGGVTVYIGE